MEHLIRKNNSLKFLIRVEPFLKEKCQFKKNLFYGQFTKKPEIQTLYDKNYE